MLRKHILLAMSVLLPSLTSAQSSATSSAASASSSPAIHRVNVGIGGFSYDPNVTIANVGDIVQFVFYPTNHSVIRAEYTGSDVCGPGGCNPCVPYEIMHGGEGGFHSGNMAVGTYPSNNSIDVWHQHVLDFIATANVVLEQHQDIQYHGQHDRSDLVLL
jgi:plastocyanin